MVLDWTYWFNMDANYSMAPKSNGSFLSDKTTETWDFARTAAFHRWASIIKFCCKVMNSQTICFSHMKLST